MRNILFALLFLVLFNVGATATINCRELPGIVWLFPVDNDDDDDDLDDLDDEIEDEIDEAF